MSTSNRITKILIVDDDPAFVEATRVVLEAKHYQVASAEDAKEGWKKYRRGNARFSSLGRNVGKA